MPFAWARRSRRFACRAGPCLCRGDRCLRVPPLLPADVPILPEVLRKAGYFTFGTGKWHNGSASFARGFDGGDTIFFGGMGDQFKMNVQPFDPAGKYPKSTIQVAGKHSATLFTDSAEKFLTNAKRRQTVLLLRCLHGSTRSADCPGRICEEIRPGQDGVAEELFAGASVQQRRDERPRRSNSPPGRAAKTK